MHLVQKLLILLLYSNLAEYAIHRWALHGWLWSRHGVHHLYPEETVFFVRNKVGMLSAMGVLGVSSLLWSFWGLLPLAFFTFYYFVMLEGAHWLIHHKHFCKHHQTHHADLEDGNYNVWLPIGDLLFRTFI